MQPANHNICLLLQQQQDSSDGAGQPQQHMQTNRSNGERTAAHTSAAQLGSTLQGDPADAEDPDSWRPTGLGYHPQHGFASASAAAQFADTSLDHMLQGNFARDMQGAVDYDSTDSGSGFDSSGSDSDDDSTTSSSGSSNSDGEGDEEGFAGSGFGGSEPVVVDATGRQQRWHDLSLEQLFPVQSRQGLSSQAAAAAGGGGGGSSARGSKQKQRPPSGSMRDALAQNISTSMLLSNRQGSIPEFHSEGLAAAVAAATSAAAELAKQQVAQYAELAQQLQRAKQNQRQRPGRQGKGVKKQLKKAKVAAKRTAREARSEAGALQLLAALEAFVGSGQDVQVLPPCGSRQKEVRASCRMPSSVVPLHLASTAWVQHSTVPFCPAAACAADQCQPGRQGGFKECRNVCLWCSATFTGVCKAACALFWRRRILPGWWQQRAHLPGAAGHT